MAIDVFVASEQSEHALDLDRYAKLVVDVLEARGIKEDAEVSLLFVDEPAIAALNEQYLHKQGSTDVLSFPIEDEPLLSGRNPDQGGTGPGSVGTDNAPLLLGDVVVCPSVALRNAQTRTVGFEDEMALLVVHGLLHLLGMDHQIEAEAEVMEQAERDLLARFHRSPGH